ncbi:MAG: efflux RND transporter permease subunit [Planctomycetaceae bacterium]
MRPIIRWAVANSAAVNTLVAGVILLGLFSMFSLRRETFPEFELEIVLVSVPYPGADPDEVETAICQKIEEAVSALAGIKEVTSIAQEGSGSVVIELNPDVPDVQKILNEIRGEVDRISTFPEQAEDPEVKQITFRETAIRLAILGPENTSAAAELRLRDIAEGVREKLLQLETVTQAEITGARPYEIDVEVPEETLRRYGLSLRDVAQAVRRENLDLPGGLLKSPSQEVMLKGENKRVVGTEIEKIPLVTDPSGVVLTIGDVGTVKDEFADTTSVTRINGRPALVVAVNRTSDEDLIDVTDAVKEFAAGHAMPAGYDLIAWDDRSVEVKDRIRMLSNDGWQGLVLVFIALSLFLELRLAFWVAAGIPIALLGTCIVLLAGGQTLNMLSLFGFLMVMGILVDDAIVISENVHVHRMMGKSALQAAIDGTSEVAVSVAASVATTVIAFTPLLFVSGVMGKFIAVLPVAVIACLLISLVETTSTLPMHLAHEPHGDTVWRKAVRTRSRLPWLARWTIGTAILFLGGVFATFKWFFSPIAFVLRTLNPRFSSALDWVIVNWYAPVLRRILKAPSLTIALGVSLLLLTAGLVQGGYIKRQFFPDLDVPLIQATITYPDGTPESVTAAAVARLAESLDAVDRKFAEDGVGPVKVVQESVGHIGGQGSPDQRTLTSGGHLGQVHAELVDSGQRNVTSQTLVSAWRKIAGEFPGAESIIFDSPAFGPAGKKIEFKLLADREHADELEQAVEVVKATLVNFPGVFDVDDDSRPGKAELRVDLKPTAVALGVQRADLFETVRAAYFGEEAMRVQRGRHEIKIMARLPEEDRRSFATFDDLRVRTTDPATGTLVQRPIPELAEVSIARGPSEINRIDRQRSITVFSDVDEGVSSTTDVMSVFSGRDPLPSWIRSIVRVFGGPEYQADEHSLTNVLENYPHVRVLWKGQAEQQGEAYTSMILGMLGAMVGMFALLTIEFKSYLQPLLILMIIPFGLVGAVLGHGIMGLPISFFSMMGMVALTGIVVNDSIVLVDFINLKLGEGLVLREAIYEAGIRRLRPVVLNSVTSVIGLVPMLLETSFQAQVLVPMACAICFGLTMTTALVLFLLPAVYSAYGHLIGLHDEPAETDEDDADSQEPHETRKPALAGT